MHIVMRQAQKRDSVSQKSHDQRFVKTICVMNSPEMKSFAPFLCATFQEAHQVVESVPL